jgi:hypothetical protein
MKNHLGAAIVSLLLSSVSHAYAQDGSKYESVYPHELHYSYDILDEGSNADLSRAAGRKYTHIDLALHDRMPTESLKEMLSSQTKLEHLILRSLTESGAIQVLEVLPEPLGLIDVNLVLPSMDSVHDQLMRFRRIRRLGFQIGNGRPFPTWIYRLPSLRYVVTTKCSTLRYSEGDSISTFTTLDCIDSSDYATIDRKIIEEFARVGVEIRYEWEANRDPYVRVDTVIFEREGVAISFVDPTVREIVVGLITKGIKAEKEFADSDTKRHHYNVVRCVDNDVLTVAGKYVYQGTLRDRLIINVDYLNSVGQR